MCRGTDSCSTLPCLSNKDWTRVEVWNVLAYVRRAVNYGAQKFYTRGRRSPMLLLTHSPSPPIESLLLEVFLPKQYSESLKLKLKKQTGASVIKLDIFVAIEALTLSKQ